MLKHENLNITTKEFLGNFFKKEDIIRVLAIKEGDSNSYPKMIDFKLSDIDLNINELTQLNKQGYGIYFTANYGKLRIEK